MRYELTDYEWTAIKPMLPNKSRGVRRVNDRRVLNGIFWVLRSGAPSRDLPETYGPRTTCYNRFVRWRRAGVWDQIMAALASPLVSRTRCSVQPAAQSRDPRCNTLHCRMGPGSAVHHFVLHRVRHTNSAQQKKAARFPKRPFLSYGGCTFHRAISELPDRGPISRSSPGRRPLHFGTVANCGPNRTRWSPISVRWGH